MSVDQLLRDAVNDAIDEAITRGTDAVKRQQDGHLYPSRHAGKTSFQRWLLHRERADEFVAALRRFGYDVVSR